MPKVYLKFELPEEQEEFSDAQKGSTYKLQLDEVWLKVFRPFYKHGYNDSKLNDLLNTKNGKYIFEKFEELYREAIKEWED